MEEVQAIQAAREESAEKRKELVEQVKQLKAADDVGRLALLNTTMRAFQKEVERLSSRAMFAEAAFERLHEQASLNQGAQEGGATLQAAMTEKEELREKLEVSARSTPSTLHAHCTCTAYTSQGSAISSEHTACTLHAHGMSLPGGRGGAHQGADVGGGGEAEGRDGTAREEPGAAGEPRAGG